MFDDRESSYEQSTEIDSIDGPRRSVQPVRVNQPLNGGAWCLPRLHCDVPFAFEMGVGVDTPVLANFALEAYNSGVQLPIGKFLTMEKTLNAQWAKYIDATCGKDSPLDLDLTFDASNESLSATVSAQSRINVLRMKPVVDALNQAHAGLGWWVYDVASKASQDMFPIYQISDLEYFLQAEYCLDEFTDECLHEWLNENNYDEERMSMEEMKQNYSCFWPSDLINAVEGYRWMLRVPNFDKLTQTPFVDEKPRIATLDEVALFIQCGKSDELKAVVRDFLALHVDLGRLDSGMKDSKLSTDEYGDEISDHLGSSCVLVWNESEIPINLIEHHEQNIMNCGECSEKIFLFKSENLSQSAINKFSKCVKDFVIRASVISKAFAHFEIV